MAELKNKIKCPICKGSGMVKRLKTHADTVKLKVKAAMILREQGFSIRAIQGFMGYKSTSAIVYLLSKAANHKN